MLQFLPPATFCVGYLSRSGRKKPVAGGLFYSQCGTVGLASCAMVAWSRPDEDDEVEHRRKLQKRFRRLLTAIQHRRKLAVARAVWRCRSPQLSGPRRPEAARRMAKQQAIRANGATRGAAHVTAGTREKGTCPSVGTAREKREEAMAA